MTQDALDVSHLRGAIELAVRVAAEGQKRKPPLPSPAALKPFLRAKRIPTPKLGRLRRAIEGDAEFREAVAAIATPELVDPIGLAWLQRPSGWEDDVRRLVTEHEERTTRDAAAGEAQRERKRREAAETAAARARVELTGAHQRIEALGDELERLRAEVDKLTDERDEMRTELIDARNEIRHARDRETAAQQRLSRAEADRDQAVEAAHRAAEVRDDAITTRVRDLDELAELSGLARAAADLAGRLTSIASSGDEHAGPGVTIGRQPLSLPGALAGSPEGAAEFLLRAGATVLVDGYNVAKLGWPDREPAEERRLLLDVIEDAARRFGVDFTVVFDGADVVGAASDQRRLARVVFSPAGVIADDVIRDEVERLPPSRSVVVVTNDQAIVDDVRAVGANTVRSEHFLAVVRR